MNLVIRTACRAVSALALIVALPVASRGGTIPMPTGSTSWISLSGSSEFTADATQVSGTFGPTSSITVNAALDAGGMHADITQTSSNFAFLFMSMIDTYTLHSSTLPDGSVVPVTVNLHAVGTMQPLAWPCCGVFGGGSVEIRISNTFDSSPTIANEFDRIGRAPVNSAQKNLNLDPPKPNAPISIDQTASWTFDAAIGTPFDVSYHLVLDPAAARFDFAHTATISFDLPGGTTITSAKGYGGATPVFPSSWGRLKSLYR